jgi:carbonic anhydrase
VTRPDTPVAAWRALREGNDRFVAGRREHPHQDADRRNELASGQRPFALVFGCSDSRVAAEIIFDRGLGDLFVVRTAGHVVDTGVLGSIEFGVELLEIPLVVVLGHDGCGAVVAALEAHESGQMPGGFVRDVVERVTPSVLSARQAGLVDLDDVIDEHTRHTAQLLAERSSAISRRVSDGRCAVVGVNYTLTDGHARLLDVTGLLDASGDETGAALG